MASSPQAVNDAAIGHVRHVSTPFLENSASTWIPTRLEWQELGHASNRNVYRGLRCGSIDVKVHATCISNTFTTELCMRPQIRLSQLLL
eukprot:3879387-Amphidinium_carterae.2